MKIPSLMQKSFEDVYDEFFFACSHGDYLSVEHLLQNGSISHADISTTKHDQRLSPIVVAIEHNHLAVIQILLDHLPYNDFREVLLLAIYLDLTKIAQIIMEHDTFKCFYGTFADWQTDTVATYDESHFAAVRPIQLAAQYNRTAILYDFLKRGERIEVPHNIECTCNECKSAGSSDSLRHSQLRLSTYRGLSSSVYLALASKDPITRAFDLSNDLSELIISEAHFRSEYLNLFNQVSTFTTHLLDHIRNQTELELLLTSERLNAAIEHNQQEFITHTNTQQRLTDLWYYNIERIRSGTLQKRILVSLYYFIIYIPMYIAYFWFPFHFERRCRWYFQQAAIQMLLHSITYQSFLLMLIFSSILKPYKTLLKDEYPQIALYYQHLLEMDKQSLLCKRTIITSLEILLLLWMLGYVQRNISTVICTRRRLGLMDLSTTILFTLYVLLFTIAAIQSHLEWKFILDINRWKHFEHLHNASELSNEYRQIKSRDYFGPLLNSLTVMSKIIYRWFIFIFIFLLAYQASFLHLFSYYFHEEEYRYVLLNISDTNRKIARIVTSFSDRKRSIINIFYTLFGVVQNELTQSYTNQTKDNLMSSMNHTHDYYLLNTFTSTAGSFLYGSLAFGTRIVLMTMIIAYIKRLYNLTKQQALNRWKFARAKLYMKYISKDPDVLPVPLNLVPTPKHLLTLFRKKSSSRITKQTTRTRETYLRSLNYIPHEYNCHTKPTSEEIMDCVVLRYLAESYPFDSQSSKRTRRMEYQQQLSDIRYHVLDELQMIQQENQILKSHISTLFFGLNGHE
ncbi:unnamed protein product [Adineta ricciae]|uniref:Transient receptor ion channel domain-containing protein n=1 Tax=Adineta ricciae TaxID=249248 RepID=A0A813SAE8_ADIRI|nr:unnamed protein product [Adineta ricciae]